jgi:hypothetical protein
MTSMHAPNCVFAQYKDGSLLGSAIGEDLGGAGALGGSGCVASAAATEIADNHNTPPVTTPPVTTPPVTTDPVSDECVGVSPVPSVWYPSDVTRAASNACPSPPTANNPDVNTPAPDQVVTPMPEVVSVSDPTLTESTDNALGGTDTSEISSLTSFPHSSSAYPHYVFAAAKSSGGVFWVKDTGVAGSGGCAVAGLDPASCPSGYLLAPGTFDEPRAVLTGQGPGHGSVRARFTYDTLFVGDNSGIWASKVDGFTGASAPSLVVSRNALGGAPLAMTGYACFDASGAPGGGDCLQVLTAYGDLVQVDVNSGAVIDRDLDSQLSDPISIDAISVDGRPELLVADYGDAFQRFSVTGAKTSELTYRDNGPGFTEAAAMIGGDLYQGTYQSVDAAAHPVTANPLTATTVADLDNQAGRVRALHSHGVPGQVYFATEAYDLGSEDPSCVRKLINGAPYTLWCEPVAPFHFNTTNSTEYGSGYGWQYNDNSAYYLVQDTPVPGATSYELSATNGWGDPITSSVAATPNPYDRGDAFFEEGPVQAMVPYGITSDWSSMGASETYNDHWATTGFSGPYSFDTDPASKDGELFLTLHARPGFDGRVNVTFNYGPNGSQSVSRVVTLTRDTDGNHPVGPEGPGYYDNSDSYRWFTRVPFPQIGERGSWGVSQVQSGTPVLTRNPHAPYNEDVGMQWLQEETVTDRIGPNDPADLVLPQCSGSWTVTETAVTPNGRVITGSREVFPSCSGGGAS